MEAKQLVNGAITTICRLLLVLDDSEEDHCMFVASVLNAMATSSFMPLELVIYYNFAITLLYN